MLNARPSRTRRTFLVAALAVASAAAMTRAQERPARRITIPTLVSSIAFAADGRTITAWDPAGFSIWNLETGRPSSREPVFGKACGRIAILPKSEDGLTIAVHCKGRLFFFDTATGQSKGEWQLREKQTVIAYTVSADGALAAAVVAGATSAAEVSDRSGAEPKTVVKAQQEIEQLSFGADGRRLVTGTIEGVSVWELPEGTLLHTFPGGPAHALSADGQWLAVIRGREVAIADVATREETQQLEGAATQLRFTADRRHLVGWTNQQVIVWDVATGSQRFTAKSAQFVSAALAPDGSRLATITLELRGNSTVSTLSIWDLP